MLALLIDGLNLVRRVYAAIEVAGDAEDHIEAVGASTVGSALRAVDQTAPSHALCVFDSGGGSWRHKLYPQYKAGRPEMPEALRQGLSRIQGGLAERGLQSISVPGFEADDVLATVASKIAARGGVAVVLSTDKSMCQLLCDRIRVRDHFNLKFLDNAYVFEKFGVTPNMLPTWFALVGDRSLHVPGVKSVGPRTATRLINQFGSLESILDASASMTDKLGKALQGGVDDARLSLQLVTLRTDVDVGANLNQFRYLEP